MQIGDGCAGQTLHSNGKARLVHHLEHDLHALPLFTQKLGIAFAVIAEVDKAGGAALDAHLMLDVGDFVVITLAQGAVLIDEVLGHEEYGYALGSRRIALDTCKNGMDDVLHQVVIAAGDEYLRALDAECAIGLAEGLGTHVAQI